MKITIGDNFIHAPISHINLVHMEQSGIENFFEQAFQAGDLTEQQLETLPLVFTTLGEGHGAREYQYVYQRMSQFSWFRSERTCVLHNTCDSFPEKILNVSWIWHMVNHEDWFRHLEKLAVPWTSLARDKDILCLMRRPSFRRKQCLDMLDQMFSPSQVCISYSNQGPGQTGQRLIDGIVDSNKIAHRASDLRFFQPLINLIAESGHQEHDKNLWNSKFISEKTFKCFAWHQVPIWWTVPDFVGHVRKLGFDVFDDVMADHAYDHIYDAEARLSALAQTLESAVRSINQRGRDRWIEDIMPRLQRNYARVAGLVNDEERHLEQIYEQIKCHLV